MRVFGGGFTGEERVFVGGAEARVLEALTSAELRVEVPASSRTGPALVEVESKDGTRVALEDDLEYVAPDASVISCSTPSGSERKPAFACSSTTTRSTRLRASAFGSSSRCSRAISTGTASTSSSSARRPGDRSVAAGSR